jgi:CRP/FNR family transcriptional regulator, cyclic AMP receptor protein
MNSDDLQRLESAGSEATFPAGHVLIERGQIGGGLYAILEGNVVVEASEGSLEFGPGAVIGERALLAPAGTRAARVRATTELRVLAIDRVKFERICADDAAFAQRLARATATAGATEHGADTAPKVTAIAANPGARP